ncbi:MAG: hypothetical protein IPP10_15990 [Candidatus Competibacteraceae bacterium]|nr:hypothetical protein [Candidatus Competibacteraceae bacterium]
MEKLKKIESEDKQRKLKIELDEQEKYELDKKKAIKKKTEEAFNKFNQFPEEKKQQLRNTFAETLPEITRKIFIKDGENSPIHRWQASSLFIETISYKFIKI